jgi:hypothetical protein
MDQQNCSFERMYDRFSPILYNIALEITDNSTFAEEILITTFLKARFHKTLKLNDADIFFQLITLLVSTTREVLLKNNCPGNFRMKRFCHTPMLSKLLFEQTDVQELCVEMKMDRGAVGKLIRAEMKKIYGEQKTLTVN